MFGLSLKRKMSDLSATNRLFDEFKVFLDRGDFKSARQKLSGLKVQLTKLPALPPSFQQSSSAQKELPLARDILEHAVFLSVKLEDDAAFERNYLQLRTYYTDTRSLIPISSREPLIVGLNLLRLLVYNRISEFHTDLELMNPEVQQSSHIQLVTQLEQWLMEGAYNKVLDARKTVPDESYAYFMEKLLSTVRDEIAECSERAYSSLAIPEAKRLMLFSSDREVADYAEERGWKVEGSKLVFAPLLDDDEGEISAVKVISNTLTYARELERIV